MIDGSVKENRQFRMKNVCYSLAMALALFSLSGCGLKGPLYFPPAGGKSPAKATPAISPVQSSTPEKNDRGDEDNPTQGIDQ